MGDDVVSWRGVTRVVISYSAVSVKSGGGEEICLSYRCWCLFVCLFIIVVLVECLWGLSVSVLVWMCVLMGLLRFWFVWYWDLKKKNYHHPHHNIIISIISIIRGKCVLSWCDGSSDRSFMVDPLSYFSFQPVLHDWFNKGCGMCYPVCGMMRIKEPLLLIGKSSPCGGSGLPVSLSERSFTIWLTPYNCK